MIAQGSSATNGIYSGQCKKKGIYREVKIYVGIGGLKGQIFQSCAPELSCPGSCYSYPRLKLPVKLNEPATRDASTRTSCLHDLPGKNGFLSLCLFSHLSQFKVMAYMSASDWLTTLICIRHLSCKEVLEMYEPLQCRKGLYLGRSWIVAESIPNVF